MIKSMISVQYMYYVFCAIWSMCYMKFSVHYDVICATCSLSYNMMFTLYLCFLLFSVTAVRYVMFSVLN